MTSLSGRVVLVTGDSAGIGRATVARLAADGTRVIACARHGDRLEEAFGGLPGVRTAVADVADAGDRAALLDRVLDRVLSRNADRIRRIAARTVAERVG